MKLTATVGAPVDRVPSPVSGCLLAAFLLLLTAFGSQAAAQTPETPKQEFRGAWIATVLNLDWPGRGVHSSFQISSLRTMLDELKASGINAVFFQVRSEADAMYESALEPWSYWLSGEQGTPSEPYYDPLELAVEEAHARGMELHAWFNPYRAVRGSGYTNSADHVSVTHPEWLLTFGSFKILNPGLPEARDHVTRVIADVVRRYDIDGVHFDDFFYPYPPNQISNEDAATFAAHNRGFTDIGDWRRDNVDIFVAAVADSINAIKPSVKFGISPFGIWKNGVPSGIVGLDAYNVIYGDALAWLGAETIDYLVPQLYWAFGGGQDYAKLAPWWAGQMNGRHLYPGHGVYRSDANTFSGSLFGANEVPRQVRFNRGHAGILGSVFFRARNLTVYPSKGFSDSLATDLYRFPALTPSMDWKDQSLPPAPGAIAYEWTDADEVTVTWGHSPEAGAGEAPARRYALYRVRSATEPDAQAVMGDARNLLAVTGDTSVVDKPGIASDPYYYFATAVTGNSIESAPTGFAVVEGRALADDGLPAVAESGNGASLGPAYPNPFGTSTQIPYSIDADGHARLDVFDVMGRRVARLVDDFHASAGEHVAQWDGTSANGVTAARGTYLVVLSVGERRVVRKVVRM